MSSTSSEQLNDAFGAYVRSQRQLAQLTLRQAAKLARISNPYLSQIEHGLALPSITVIGALAEALSLSVETLLLRAAGIVAPYAGGPASHTEQAIRQDPRLDEAQKHALLSVLASFVDSSAGAPAGTANGAVRRSHRPSASTSGVPMRASAHMAATVPAATVPAAKAPAAKAPAAKAPAAPSHPTSDTFLLATPTSGPRLSAVGVSTPTSGVLPSMTGQPEAAGAASPRDEGHDHE